MTEATTTAKQVLQDLYDSLTQLIQEAENRRKSASAKNKNYKVEYSEGEKNAYEGVARTIRAGWFVGNEISDKFKNSFWWKFCEL